MYAELLINIRQVTVFAILPSDCHGRTQIRLLSDQKTIVLQHEGQDASVELPCQVVKSTTLKIPSAPTKEFSFRLGINSDASLHLIAKSIADADVPWSSSKLSSETQIACQCCGNSLVKDVLVWKDLPSGGWADMMDFWHCHKPSIEDATHDNHSSMKGYAAGNDLGPTTGVGLVDISHFLLDERDCIGLQVCHQLFVNPLNVVIPF